MSNTRSKVRNSNAAAAAWQCANNLPYIKNKTIPNPISPAKNIHIAVSFLENLGSGKTL
jgi:hypothetical protein